MLSTLHHCKDYKSGENFCVAKFMPCYDGPYHILAIDKSHFTVTLDLPEKLNTFPVFHTSEIHPFLVNNNTLFPHWALNPPDPISIDRQKEFYIDKIIDQQQQGHGHRYLVWWCSEGLEGDKWLPAKELEDCKALDKWQEHQESQAHEDSRP